MKGSLRKRGDNWYYNFSIYVDGKRKKYEKKGGRTKKEAEGALRKALAEFEGTGEVFNQSEISFSDFLDFWFKNYVELNLKYNTKCDYTNTINNHIKPYFKNYKLKALTPALLQEYINSKYINGYAKSTLSNHYGLLSIALKSAVHPYGYIKDNPMQYVNMPKYNDLKNSQTVNKIISKDDFSKIITRFNEDSNFYIPLQIAYHTGLRSAEVCGLTWDCIDLCTGFIDVNKNLIIQGSRKTLSTTKNVSSRRKIKIGKSLINILNKHKKRQLENGLKYGEFYTRYINKNNVLFTTHNKFEENIYFVNTKENGEIITTNSLKYLSRVINYELLIDFNFHALRHTHATMLIEAGANMKDVQVRLGHSNLATTMDTYSHVTDKMNSDTVDLFESIIL